MNIIVGKSEYNTRGLVPEHKGKTNNGSRNVLESYTESVHRGRRKNTD